MKPVPHEQVSDVQTALSTWQSAFVEQAAFNAPKQLKTHLYTVYGELLLKTRKLEFFLVILNKY